MKKSVLRILLFSFMTIAFSLSYFNNFWKVVGPDTFKNSYDRYCQSQVLGRINRAETNGIFSEAGLNGWVRDDSIMKDYTWEQMCFFQENIYKEELILGPSNFIIYDSQMGGQAIFFAFIDKISPFSNSTNLNLFLVFTSLSLALIMTVFIYWLSKVYGLVTALITFILLLSSSMLTMLGNDLYLVLSSFYLPFIIMLMMMYFESSGKLTITNWKLFLASLVLISVKLFFSGFEFITTALIMFTVPVFYYLFLNKWKLKLFINRFLSIVSGSVSAIIIHSILYAYQLSSLKGNLMWGINNILSCFLRRSYGNSSDFPDAFKASLEASVPDVLKLYYNSPALGYATRTILNFDSLIIILIIFSLLCYIPKNISKSVFEKRKINRALMITTWISLLAPLSWFVIFKAHAFVHFYGYDDIVWCMPFSIFGFALIGSLTGSIIKDFIDYTRSKIIILKD